MTKEQTLWIRSYTLLCHLQFIRANNPEVIKQRHDNGADYIRALRDALRTNKEYAPEGHSFLKQPN